MSGPVLPPLVALAALALPVILAGCAAPGGTDDVSCVAGDPPGRLLSSSPTREPDRVYNYSTSASGHPHADFKVFLGEEPFSFAQQRYMVTVTQDRSIHLEGSDVYPPHEWGDVIHLHDSNVTLVYFLGTFGWKAHVGAEGVAPYILTDTGEYHGAYGPCEIRVFVEPEGGEWEERAEGLDSVLHPNDRVLVTYGSESEGEVALQQAAVTSKARSGRL